MESEKMLSMDCKLAERGVIYPQCNTLNLCDLRVQSYQNIF